jgi:hypothetical protein
MTVIAGFELPTDLNTPTSLQKQASDLKRTFERETLPLIRADHTTSPEGKRILIAAAFIPVLEGVARIREQELNAYVLAEARTKEALFGTISSSADVISTRDAFDRVEQIPREGRAVKANALLKRALTTKDHGLAQAIIATAVAHNWTDFLSTYRDENPGSIGPIEDYTQLRRYDPFESPLAGYTYRVKNPHEIANMTIAGMRELVASGPTRNPADVFTNVSEGIYLNDSMRDQVADPPSPPSRDGIAGGGEAPLQAHDRGTAGDGFPIRGGSRISGPDPSSGL